MSEDNGVLSRYVAPVVAGVASLATIATIGPVFSDQHWLLTCAAVIAIMTFSGMLLRAFGLGQAYTSALQLLLGFLGLLVLTCRPTLVAGFIPSGDTFSYLIDLIGEGAHTARTKVAPITPTPGTAALLALLTIPVAALVDDCAVTGRAALAGVPLLTLFAICAAIVRHPISLWLVVVPVVCYLLLLWIAELDRQPRKLANDGIRWPAAGGLLTTGIMAAIAVALAAMATTAIRLPDGGIFAVPGNTDRSPNERVARSTDLIGQLSRTNPLPLMQVTTDDPSPFYLRAVALDSWGKTGWTYTNPVSSGADLAALPDPPLPAATATTHAKVKIERYNDVFAPVFYSPASITVPDAQFDQAKAVVLSGKPLVEGQTYDLTSHVPRPTSDELAAVAQTKGEVPKSVQPDLVVPADVDPSVVSLTQQVVGAGQSPWQVAAALDAFFSSPANGFGYTLQVPDPQGMDPLASFLQKRQGFCEQYSSAMAAMFRISGVPARVVVGYTPGKPDASGVYNVTTADAHAWVEAYFADRGWIAFDPTPIGDRAVPLPYVPSDQISPQPPSASPTPAAPSAAPASGAPSAAPATEPSPEPAAAPPSDGSRDSILVIARWVLIGLLAAAVLAMPSALRQRRWHQRRALAEAGGSPGALAAWDELRELAADLGHSRRGALSERAQSRKWAEDLGVPEQRLEPLAISAEQARYSRGETIEPTIEPITRAREDIKTRVGRRRWLLALAIPAAVRRRRKS